MVYRMLPMLVCVVMLGGCVAYQPGGLLSNSEYARAAGIDDEIENPDGLSKAGAAAVRSVPIAEAIAGLADTFGAARVAAAADAYAASMSAQAGRLIEDGRGGEKWPWLEILGISAASALTGGAVGGRVQRGPRGRNQP